MALVSRCPLGGVVAVECKHKNIATIGSHRDRSADQALLSCFVFTEYTCTVIAGSRSSAQEVTVLSLLMLNQRS